MSHKPPQRQKPRKASGAAGRRRRKLDGLAVRGRSRLRKLFAAIGSPPKDPVLAVIWSNRLSAAAAWAYAYLPLSDGDLVRLRGVLDSVRTHGMTNSKAVDKERLRRIEKRLGIGDEDPSAELEDRAVDSPPALRARSEAPPAVQGGHDGATDRDDEPVTLEDRPPRRPPALRVSSAPEKSEDPE